MKTIIASLLLLLLGGCHCEKKATLTNAGSSPKTEAAPNDAKEAMKNLVVSFYSTGGGANYKAAKQFEDFLFEYGTKTNTVISFDKIPWGKEGEVDYCISLEGWTDESGNNFKAKVNNLLRGVQVHIKENTACRSKK